MKEEGAFLGIQLTREERRKERKTKNKVPPTSITNKEPSFHRPHPHLLGNGPGGPKFMVKVQRLMFSSQIHLAEREEFSLPQMPICNPPQVLSLSLSSQYSKLPSLLPCTLFVWTLFVFVSWSGSDFPRDREREGEKGKVPSQVLSPLSIYLSIYLYPLLLLSIISSLSLYIFFWSLLCSLSVFHLGLASPLDLLILSLSLSLCP